MFDFKELRPARPAARIEPPETPSVQGLITLAVGVTVIAALYFAREILIPFTLAILLSFLVAPLANLLGRIKLGHVASVLLAVTMSVSVIVVLGGIIATQITDLAVGIPRYQATIDKKISVVHGLTVGKLNQLAGTAGQALQRATVDQPKTIRESSSSSSGTQPPAALPVEVREPAQTPFQLARRILSPVVSPLETAFIVFVVTIVILLQRDDLRDRAIRLFGSRDLHRTTTAMDEAARRLSRYFVSQLGLNAGVGVVIGTGLFIIGVPSPVLWGILAALLRLVPYVGIWISAILATALAAAVSPEWSMAIWSLVLFVTVELLAGQAVEPLLYGHSTGLSPFSVVVAAIFWSWIWGPIGLILSTPLTLCLLVLGRHVTRLEFLDVLLGDQPALSPVENFYQRALAGDPDDAVEQARILLRDRPLSSYYDEIVLKGLQLAADDVLRGGVTPAQLARIETTVNDLIEGLDGFADTDPATDAAAADRGAPAAPAAGQKVSCQPARNASSPGIEARPVRHADNQVLCIAGRGALDELASAILVQLLGKHDLDCRVVNHDAASRVRIDGLDVTAVTIVCIFYLAINGIPSHLRYLLRRVRQRLPDALIVVGLWPAGDTGQWPEDLRSAIGADHYATSVRDMVNACIVSTGTASAFGSEPKPNGVAAVTGIR
ncbi:MULTISPECIES: AI-2E family transporter [Burkholderia cepacia complex]|uniref:AI-2E family transporter n=1 Tax=Burkholderia cepacia complex TaxID=87882 RepID=UPI0002781FF2|nr:MULTISPECIES: AI-2E family transporter [Burkholderia cepacia complex]EJO59711.1 putative membrane protein [Burkholderia multivorans CF2]MBJ9625278.1 AI-2E family transporter [Burkholderia multivorans]MBJ9658417.1 AI-2E family transporter [Burkholderia multivorans]MBU9162323.1 AI-2E family transporter [Burkholderia multivorans]MBU9204410.1 AI-2E family transporter [Burkholderia multivorans]